MLNLHEVLLTADDSLNNSNNIRVLNAANGTTQMVYKGGNTALHTTALLGHTFIISAPLEKPILNVWQLNRHEQRPTKVTTPSGPIRTLTASSDGKILIVAIAEEIYVWQTSSGRLLAVLRRHFQPVICLSFNQDDSLFISGGVDGAVLVWNMGIVTAKAPSPEPMWTWNDHCMSVTDMYVGSGALKGRVYTSSIDKTVKIYCLASGHLLLDVVFSIEITSVVTDHTESNIFAGTASGGKIFNIGLLNPPRDLRIQIDDIITSTNCFVGHSETMAVRCLSVSLDDTTLASGSDDGSVRLWHVRTRQCLRTILSTAGSRVTLVRFITTPPGMISGHGEYCPDSFIAPLDRIPSSKDFTNYKIQFISFKNVDSYKNDSFNDYDDFNEYSHDNSSNCLLKHQQKINSELYQFAIKHILGNETK